METSGWPPRPAGLRRALYRFPVLLYRANLGVLLGHRFVLIDHIGRTSGKRRQTVVEVAMFEERTGAVSVVSGFGPGADWYRNLLAHPDVSIHLGARSVDVRAVPLPPEQAARVMLDYARRHPRTARRLARFMGFAVDGSEKGYLEAGRGLPAVRLEPRG